MIGPQIIIDHDRHTVTYEADTWAQFVHDAARPSEIQNPQSRRMLCDYRDFETLISKALFGDHELTAELSAIGDRLPQTTSRLSRRRPTPALAGHTPIVGAYLAGDPRSMLRFTPSEGRPILKIGVNVSMWGGAGDREVNIRGAAVLTLAHKLEAAGYAVEIDALDPTDFPPRGDTAPKWTFYLYVKLKHATTYANPSILAVALLRPTIDRPFFFSIVEQTPELAKLFIDRGYGQAIDTDPRRKNYDAYIPAIDHYNEDFKTPEAAAQWCRQWLDKLTGKD